MADDPQEDQPAAAPFETSLRLTDIQLRRLIDHVMLRLEECCREMGRGVDGTTVGGSWLDRRRTNQLWYEGDLEWRKSEEYLGGVFVDSNFSRGDGKRYARHMTAKITDDLIGTAPFFAAMKRPNGDQSPSGGMMAAIEEFAQDGVESSNVPEALREAVELALVRNEAVVKLRNVFDASGYMGPAEVLVDQGGQPVVTKAKGLYVMKDDDFLTMPSPAQAQAAPNGGMFALEKDSSFTVTAQERAAFRYQSFDNLPQTQVERQGLEAKVLDPRDFICPLKINDIHEADICAHYYDESPAVLKQVYGGYAVGQAYFTTPESGEKAPIASQGEQATTAREQEWVAVGEVYVRFDADGDGREEHIFLVLDRDTNGGTALFYDYLNKHMAKRPFEVIHGLRKVPARWYGVGIFSDKFDQLVFVDKTFNRINLKNSKACTVTAVRRGAIEEWADQKEEITLGGDEVLTLKDNWSEDKGEWLEQKRLVEVSQEEMELMQTMIQAMDQEFGFISAADAGAADLNPSHTATGVASIERSSNNVVKAVERIHSAGIERVLEQCVDILLEHMDPQRLAVSKDSQLLTLNRDEIRALPRDVRLLLTRSRSSELLSSNQQAAQKANEYFDLMEAKPRRARALRPLYISQLRALEVQDADNLLPEVTDEMIAAVEQQRPPDQPPKESISIKYESLLPSEKAQALIKLGIKPGNPNELGPPPPDNGEPPAAAPAMAPRRPQPTAPVLAGAAAQ